MNLKKETKIYIAGHKGMVGSAVWRALESKGYSNLIGKTSAELDLRNQQAVLDFYTMNNQVWLLMLQQKLEVFLLIMIFLINF